MNPADNIKRFFKNASVSTNPKADREILEQLLQANEQAAKEQRYTPAPNTWSIIMHSKITKLSAAAATIIAVALGITFLSRSLPAAYAIEQTVEAMRHISTIHTYETDWDNSQGQTWTQLDPQTGEEKYYRADGNNLLIVGTPQATYYYHKDKNLVRIRNEYVPTSDVRISHLFEDLILWIQKYNGELRTRFEYDEELQQEVIIVHGSIPTQGDMLEKEFIIRVDPETKLPISMEAIKCGPGQGVKSIDRLEYNVAIPEGIFEFEIPDGAKVVYESKDNENGRPPADTE